MGGLLLFLPTLPKYYTYTLAGGFKLFFSIIYWDVILPIDELIFFKMVKTTNQISIIIIHHNYGKSQFSMGLYYQLYGVILHITQILYG